MNRTPPQHCTGLEFFRPPLSTTTANYDGKNIRAFANVFDRDYTPVSFINCVDCVFAQNTVVGSTTRIVRVLPGNTLTSSVQSDILEVQLIHLFLGVKTGMER